MFGEQEQWEDNLASLFLSMHIPFVRAILKRKVVLKGYIYSPKKGMMFNLCCVLTIQVIY